jgi:aminoglycoside phosphotransferase (APT) family kinase protein
LNSTGQIEKAIPGAAAEEFLRLLRRDGLVQHDSAKLTPLTDGVSSEIFRVDDGDASFVVKRALPKLRVRDDWTADVARNRYEQMYIEYVAQFLPQAVPRLLPGPHDRGYFAMEFFAPEFTSWKKLLLGGDVRSEHALRAAELLGVIHARSAGDADVAARFDTTANFMQLRIEPYLLTTGRHHPDSRPLFDAEAERLAGTRICLVHGDFSPKNMMISSSRFVLLDCEVAWYGDPAFDLAFLLTHLLLKGLYLAPRQIGLEEMSDNFWRRYVETVGKSIDIPALEIRVARLLPMLLLARVDGKSPVEYLIRTEQADFVRRFTRSALTAEPQRLSEVIERWFDRLGELEPAR